MTGQDPIAGSSRSVRSSGEGRSSDETVVERQEAGPLPKKQGELGWTESNDQASQEPAAASDDQLPARHPADRPSSTPPEPTAPSATPETALPSAQANASSSSIQSHSSAFKQFLRKPRPLPTVRGIRSSTLLRVVLVTGTLIGTIIGWAITVTQMNKWANEAPQISPPSSGQQGATPSSDAMSQMANSSLVFVHVGFGGAVLFQLFMLERAVYRLRAERYAFLHPDEVLAAGAEGLSVMGLAPWNRPPLPTYAAALGVRGTGDVEDNIIAVPPPPEYGNTRGSTLLLSAHLPSNLTRPTSSHSRPTSRITSNPISVPRPTSQRTLRDALGRTPDAWSRPVSYAEDELRLDARRSLDLEAALSQLEGGSASEGRRGIAGVARPENAVVRR